MEESPKAAHPQARQARASAALCLTGQLRGICSPDDLWGLHQHVLATFSKVDLFLIVPTGDDCRRAVELFPNATALVCVPDEPFSEAERRWIAHGPHICWKRERYLLQIRLVYHCGRLLRERMEAGAGYQWLLRARADARWEHFIDAEELEQGDDTLHLAWGPMMLWQAIAHDFAVGRPDLMLPYLYEYPQYVLDPQNWPEYDQPLGTVAVRRQWGHPCNYPEMILERFLFRKGLLARYSRKICYVRMESCGEVREAHCGPRIPPRTASDGSYPDDLMPFRRRTFFGKEIIPEQTHYAHYDTHDPIFAGKLVEFFHREESRLGRPMKIVDLGCGRGTLVREFSMWQMLAVGIDGNPLLSAVIPENGAVEDITANLSFTIRSLEQRCDYNQEYGYYSPGLDFELVEDAKEVGATTRDRWVDWILYLMAKCCQTLTCKAIGTDGYLKYGIHPPHGIVSTLPYMKGPLGSLAAQGLYIWVKREHEPPRLEALISSNVKAAPGFLYKPEYEGAIASMDWAISLDVAEHIPARLLDGFFASIGSLAREGVIFRWGAPPGTQRATSTEADAERRLRRLGFARDHSLEAELRLFAGVGCNDGLRQGLLVFRKARWRHEDIALPCNMQPLPPVAAACEANLTYGCVDRAHVWVSRGCAGTFQRGDSGGWCQSWGQYEECMLPEVARQEEAASHLRRLSSRRSLWPRPPLLREFARCHAGDFSRLHGSSVADIYGSADPLIRPGENIWAFMPCGELVVALKLFRLLALPIAAASVLLHRSWESEWRFVLLAWDWVFSRGNGAGWLPELLVSAAYRAYHTIGRVAVNVSETPPHRSASRAPIAFVARIASQLRSCLPQMPCSGTMSRVKAGMPRALRAWGRLPLWRGLVEGAPLWAALAARARRRRLRGIPLPLRCQGSEPCLRGGWDGSALRGFDAMAARYLQRFSFLPP